MQTQAQNTDGTRAKQSVSDDSVPFLLPKEIVALVLWTLFFGFGLVLFLLSLPGLFARKGRVTLTNKRSDEIQAIVAKLFKGGLSMWATKNEGYVEKDHWVGEYARNNFAGNLGTVASVFRVEIIQNENECVVAAHMSECNYRAIVPFFFFGGGKTLSKILRLQRLL